MNFKAEMRKLLHKFYKKDNWVNAFLTCVQAKIDDIITVLDRIGNLSHFNRLDTEGCKWWANHLKINLPSSMSLSEKQAFIRSKWRSNGHNSITLIKNICSSWENGQVEAKLETDSNNKAVINLNFSGEYGIPSDVDSLLKMIDEIKPAHIPYQTNYKYLLIRDIHEVKTIAEMEEITLDQFAKGRED